MDKELKEMIEIGRETNILLKRSNKVITATVIVNIITIIAIVLAVLK